MFQRIGFIGAGKVGTSLGRHFTTHELDVSGFYSKTASHARGSADFTGSTAFETLSDLVEQSDLIFVTVPDGEIVSVWEHLRICDLKGKTVCHCSGLLPSSVFAGGTSHTCETLSVHPLLAFPDKYRSYEKLEGAFVTIEGSRTGPLKTLLESLDNKVAELPASMKARYHAAAVMLTNQVVGLAHQGSKLLQSCDLPDEFAQEAWKQLFLSNAENIVSRGVIEALTGPIERNDGASVAEHLSALSGSSAELYRLLSQEVLEIAHMKHPERDYSSLHEELI